MRDSAFTLSELLIALAILGLIATFTIPKVLQSVGNGSRTAIFEESVAALSELTYEGVLNGEFGSPGALTPVASFYVNRLNGSIVCASNASTEGC